MTQTATAPAPAETGTTGDLHVITIVNAKGGVSKTATTLNLAAVLRDMGRRVLVVDTDPQASVSVYARIKNAPGPRLEDVLRKYVKERVAHADANGLDLGEAWLPPGWEDGMPEQVIWTELDGEPLLGGGIGVVPCSLELNVTLDELFVADVRAGRQSFWDYALGDLLRPLEGRYDYVIIDTGPSTTKAQGIALLAATALLVPMKTGAVDVDAVQNMVALYQEDLREANPDLRMLGVLLTQTPSPRSIEVRNTKGDLGELDLPLIPVDVPKCDRAPSAAAYGLAFVDLEPDGRVAEAYRAVARHIEAELGIAA